MTGKHAAVGGDRLLAVVARRDWALLAGLGVGSLALTGGALLLPTALGHAVDAAISRSGADGWLVACAVIVTVFAAAETTTEMAIGIASATATARLRELLAGHVLAVGAGLPERGGDTVSRIVGSAAEAGAGPASVVTSVAAAIPPAGAVVALGLIDPWLAVAFTAGFPALALMLRALARDSSRIGTDYGRAQGAIAARLLDALTGARTIAAAGTQAAERQRILAPLPVLRGHGYATWRVQGRAAAQSTVITPVLQVIVVGVAGLELARHQLTPGGLAAASQYTVLATGIGASAVMVARLGKARGAIRRAAELFEAPPQRYGTAAPRDAAKGELTMRGVTVRRGGEAVLRRLDLTVPGGAVVAIVGRSGAGKSTLAELAGRLRDPDQGSVRLDGTDLRRLTRAALRETVVYAFERPHLLGATPFETIAFGPVIPPDSRVATAAADAQAAPFIERLPLRYDTPLEEAPLSGGEVQRLGLARAFAHAGAARLLVLDDATSSLDTVTEMLVSRAMTERLRGRTRLIVAHRAATAARADLVAWLDEGRIRAVAPHDELWREPDYRALFGAADAEHPAPAPRPCGRRPGRPRPVLPGSAPEGDRLLIGQAEDSR